MAMSSLRRRWRRALRPVVSAAVVALVVGVGVLGAAPGASAATVRDQEWWLNTYRMNEVWPITRGAGVTVAVIDSGVDASIPELAGAVLPGIDYTDAGGDGRVDRDTFFDGHGTAMAALIAARGTGSGMIGLAPEAKILPIGTREGPDSQGDEANGIRWAADHGAKVINMSFGQGSVSEHSCSDNFRDAVRYAVDKDVVLVASAGNVPGGPASMPAACPGVISVGAFDLHLHPWVNTHRDEYVDAIAAGVDMVSVRRGGKVVGGSGTSDSAALVSAMVALLRSRFPTMSAREVVTRLFNTAHDLSLGVDEQTGAKGGLRPYQALTENVPPNSPNPVYDEYDKLRPSPSPSATPSAARSEVSGPGVPRWVWGAGAAVLLLVVALGVVVLSHRRRTPGGPPPGSPFPPPPLPDWTQRPPPPG